MSGGLREFDFIVAGGGITAAVMAALLVARRLALPERVALVGGIDLAPEPKATDSDWDLRVFAMSPASERLLKIIGVWQTVPPARRAAYERMRIWNKDPPDGGVLCFDAAELGEPHLGNIVEARALLQACVKAASAAGVAFLDAPIESIRSTPTGLDLRLGDGRHLASALLIAADGAASPTRRLLGIATAGHSYRQEALVAHVRTAKPHAATAWQRFLPDGPLAFLPLPDGRSSIVWTSGFEAARRLRALDPAAFGNALTAASGKVLGACELTSPVAGFPLELQYALTYLAPHAVMVGDAAHVIHPMAGQGLNLGLLDCAVLCDILAQEGGLPPARRGEHAVLRRYERRRRSDNLLAATALDGLQRLFANDDPLIEHARSLGLRAVNRLPFLKRQLALRAMGLGGEIPEFLRRDGERSV